MYYIQIIINNILPKIDDVQYIVKIISLCIIKLSEIKPEQTLWPSELEVNGFDLKRLDQLRLDQLMLLVSLKLWLHVAKKKTFVLASKVFFANTTRCLI